jgi:radical SAM superfamily enzyme YgiQ (UPF0313 family)
MDKPSYSVSPTLIIALHAGQHPRDPKKLVGWVPGAANRTLLTRPNALVLAELASGRTRWEPAARATVPDAAAWEAALKSLARSGLCVKAGEVRGRPPPFDSEIERRGDTAIPPSPPLPSHLQLPWNFAMRPGPGGLLAFSARAGKYLLLPPEAVDVLLSFVNLAEVAAVCADERPHARAWVEWFASRGLLIAAQAEPDGRVVQSRFADLRSAVARELAQLPEEMKRLAEALATQPIPRSTEKTPLYLVYVATSGEIRGQIPLALGMLLAHIRAYEGGALLESYQVIPELLFSPSAVRDAVQRHGPGVVFFSDYAWSLRDHLRISKALKEASPEFVTVHGGPSIPASEAASTRFLTEHGHVDVAVRGEGEMTAAEILKVLAPFRGSPAGLHRLRDVAGLTFRDPSSDTGLTRTADRARAVDVNVFPSAYLSGAFNACRIDDFYNAMLETNRGCPYGCTFCDWGQATLQKIKKFDLERIRGEIEWIASHHIPIIMCTDANFGIFERDVEIAKMLADARQRHGFPRQFMGSYAKNATARVAEIVRILRDAGISAEWHLAMQTTDETTLEIVRRSNIKPQRFDELLQAFRDLKLPVETDLMLGLPGSTVDSFARDLQYCIDRSVSAKAYDTTVLVNSPMADPAYREKYRIETDEKDEIVSTFSFTREELQVMKRLYEAYVRYETSGILFYILRYLQWDHRIQATDFLRRFVEVLAADPGAYPALSWVARYSPWNLNVGGWRPYYEELARYIGEQYGIASSSGLDTALRVQEAVTREPGRRFPDRVSLPHDFVSWWRDHGSGTARQPVKAPPLHSYPPAELVVEDPQGLCQLDLTRQRQYGTYYIHWEMHSELRAAETTALFLNTG